MTITSVPSVSCHACHRIAQSFGDEDLAAAWDGCLRFSCLRHGYTIHSTYSTVPPYPSFIAAVSLRCDGTIVINTANFLHVISVQVEFPEASANGSSDQDLFLAPLSEWDDDSARSFSVARSTCSMGSTNTPNMSPACLPHPQRLPTLGAPSESEYDFMEDATEPPVRETISAFRKRRLADKKYEFKDENTENVPLKVMRKRRDHAPDQQLPSILVSESKDVNDDWEWNFSTVGSTDVLRPFNSNIPTPSLRSPEWNGDTPAEEVVRPPPLSKFSEPPTCVAQFHRRYFEVDDELVSVITDIEGNRGKLDCF